jgi:hypothetical protein
MTPELMVELRRWAASRASASGLILAWMLMGFVF